MKIYLETLALGISLGALTAIMYFEIRLFSITGINAVTNNTNDKEQPPVRYFRQVQSGEAGPSNGLIQVCFLSH